MSDRDLRPETMVAHALTSIDAATGAVTPPLNFSTTFARDENYLTRIPQDYQRGGSPNLWQAEAIIARLEKGVDAKLFASGMAAAAALLETVPLGGHVVAQKVIYYGIRAWLERLEKKGRIRLTFFDSAQPETLLAALQEGKTDLVWIETPSNPTWDVIDIAAAAQAAHAAGAVLVVDATTTAGVTTNPISLGADYVFHSATKYLNGHSDILAGVVVAREINERWDDVQQVRTKMSAPLAPFECWLLMRGMRTLFIRYRQCCANALAIARHFSNHPNVERIIYPGLKTHPQYKIAKRQMQDGYTGMMSLLIRGGFDDAKAFCTRLKLIIPATSLGGVESLAEHRKTIEGATSPVPDNLVRLSIGIENVNDLIEDLDQALG